ncbi:MAG: response regulator [bacterium]|nr:response regulator [bacterium]
MKFFRKILVVEDDSELLRLYKIRLEKAGYKVVTAEDGEKAVVKAIGETPDLILLDLMLPKQGGIQVIRILKSNPMLKEIPILVLTAYDHFNYRKDAQPHVIDFLLKTEVTPQKIIEIIDEYFSVKS